MSRCATCGKLFIFSEEESRHRCPPAWEVWEVDDKREYAHVVYAETAEVAAEKWAEWFDWSSGDYPIVGGEETFVCAARKDDPGIVHLAVSGESVPSYRAVAARRKAK
jgi:hypothetical protein